MSDDTTGAVRAVAQAVSKTVAAIAPGISEASRESGKIAATVLRLAVGNWVERRGQDILAACGPLMTDSKRKKASASF